jgi:hypothetical protein
MNYTLESSGQYRSAKTGEAIKELNDRNQIVNVFDAETGAKVDLPTLLDRAKALGIQIDQPKSPAPRMR